MYGLKKPSGVEVEVIRVHSLLHTKKWQISHSICLKYSKKCFIKAIEEILCSEIPNCPDYTLIEIPPKSSTSKFKEKSSTM